jgi:hypothetical protein
MERTHRSHAVRRLLILVTLILVLISVVAVLPVHAQEGETPEPSMADELAQQPDILAPMVVPAILALGGILTLMAFLGWVINRMPESGT